MSRVYRLLLLSLGILSTQVAAAKVTISSVARPVAPGVTFSGERYLVCWVDPRLGYADVYAHRVSSDMDKEEPEPILVSRPLSWCSSLDVATDGSDFLVTWELDIIGGDHSIQCCIVRGAGYPRVVQTVAEGSDSKQAPTVAYASPSGGLDCYLVAWLDHRGGNPDIYVSRVSRDGVVLDEGGYLLVHGRDVKFGPCVTSDGEQFFVVWYEETGGEPRLYGLTVSTELDIPAPHCIFAHAISGAPDAVFAGCLNRYVVVWPVTSPLPAVVGRACLTSGEPESDAYNIQYSSSSWLIRPKCAASDMNVMAVWTDPAPIPSPQIRCRRALARDAVGPVEDVCLDADKKDHSSVASDGSLYLVVWVNGEPSNYTVCADTVTPWQRHFHTQSDDATSLNQQRNICKDPMTGWLHVVYESGDSILYSYSTNGGTDWYPYEWVYGGPLARAEHPSLVVEANLEPNPVWVCCWRDGGPTDQCVDVFARLGPCDWIRKPMSDQGIRCGYPSMSPCYAWPLPSVYLAYTVEDLWPPPDDPYIVFYRVTLESGRLVTTHYEKIQEMVEPLMTAPCIATTPGDVVHVAWQRSDEERIYYKHWWDGIWPLDPAVVSPPHTEPASFPYVEAYGCSVMVGWRASNGSPENGEVWWRPKLVSSNQGFVWDPVPKSSSPNLPSEFPQLSTDQVVAWQELVSGPDGWDVWRNVAGQVDYMWQSDFPSKYPSITAELPAPGGPTNDIVVDAVWTEVLEGGTETRAEVIHRRFAYDPNPGFGRFTCDYYGCTVGDSVQSPFCLARDGYAQWRDYSVDYGREGLRYRLPFLNPNFDYKLMAVLYQASRDPWEQTFAFDKVRVARAKFRPLVPETLLVDIPRELYKHDCEVVLDISRLAGEYAAVAGLTLYQCWPYWKGQGGGGYLPVVAPEERTPLGVVGPTPSLGGAKFAYSVLTAQPVSITIFDAQGREVKTLVCGVHKPGEYSVRWDGTDKLARRVSAGTYFCRMVSTDSQVVRKVVLAR